MSDISQNTRKKVLVIEDDIGLVRTLNNLLQIEGYDVITASDGDAAIRIAFSEMPDLIICDIVMTKINGYDVLRVLKNAAKTSRIPFIYLTGKVKEKEKQYGLQLGADEYMCKPFEYDDLLETISRLLSPQPAHKGPIFRQLGDGQKFSFLSF